MLRKARNATTTNWAIKMRKTTMIYEKLPNSFATNEGQK